MNAPNALLRARPSPDDSLCVVALLKDTPLGQLEETVIALKTRRSPEEVRKGMVERIARAPLSDFEALKHIYIRHCGEEQKY